MRLFSVVLLLALSGCAHGLAKSVHSFGMNEAYDVSREKARPLEAESSQLVVFGTTQLDYVDETREKLLAQCPQGRIVNIRTKYSTDMGFFAWRNKLKVKATCLE